MDADEQAAVGQPVHYVEVDEALCNGCVLCMKACPMKAIRVRDGVARIEGVCIDCMECARVCPQGAIRGVSMAQANLKERSEDVVCPSSVLYSQFGEDFLPNDVLLGLRKMGFRYPFDQSYTVEIYTFAMELLIEELRETDNPPFPLISAVCPPVVQIIACRFPSLLTHIPPLATPREIVTREAKRRLSSKHSCSPEDIEVLHVVPCPALMIRETTQANQDRAVGINTIHEELKRAMQEIEEDRVLHYSGGLGLGWGISGGEIAGLKAKGIAVSGVHETIRYLEQVEMGLLDHIEFLECRICKEGCVGGPFAVSDRYQTKQLVQRYVRMFGEERRIKQNFVKKLYREGWFRAERPVLPIRTENMCPTIAERIEQQKKVEAILAKLPNKHCGMCGAPDCRTFAEDVVAGKSRPQQCRKLRDLGEMEVPLKVEDVIERLGLEVAAGRDGLDRKVRGCYCGDLLSDVMANAEDGSLWLTIQSHKNIVGVAVLRELAAVILVNGREPDEDTRAKADEEGIPILTTTRAAFETAGLLRDAGVGGTEE